MSEDLEQMVSGYEPEQEENEEVVNNENSQEQENNEVQHETQGGEETVNVTNFTDWFRQNSSQLAGIFNIPVQVTNVDADKNLLMSVSKDDEDSERYIYIFRHANNIPMLDLDGNSMRVFTNDNFQVNCNLDENRVVKCYGLKTSTICIPCFVYNNNTIFHTVKFV